MDEYKISLGIDLNDSQLKDVKRQLTNLTDNTHRIRIDIDNSRLLKQIKQAKSELKGLNDISGNNKPLNINTGSLEGSLNRVANALDDIKKTLGTLDDKSDMKSLLSSINQITASLGKATDESQNLVNALSALGKKDFGFNFNLKSGNSSPIKAMTDYGREARNKTIPALQEQATYLQELLGGTVKADSALEKYLVKLYKFNGISVKNNLLDEIVNTNSMSKQMDALERYVGYLKKVASTKGIDLSGFDAKFSKTADELVDDTLKIQTGAKQAEEELEKVGDKLKQVFGSGIDANGLSAALEPITADLKTISEFIDNLAKNNSIDGLTQSFNNLSKTLDKLLTNFKTTKDILDTGFSNNITESLSNGNTVKAAQQTGKKIGDTIEESVKQSINLDDVIDKEVLSLMKEYGVKGKKGSASFNDIRQSLVNYRDELKLSNSLGVDDEFASFGVANIRKVTSAIANHKKEINQTALSYKELKEYVTSANKNAKIHLPDTIRQEYGDDFSSMRKSLGKAFTTGSGVDFETWIEQLNYDLGHTIDLSQGAEAAFGDLYNKLNLAKGSKYISGDDLFKQGDLNVEDISNNIVSALDAIDKAEMEIAQSSIESANIVTQNEEKKRQEYEKTLAEKRQELEAINKTIKDFDELIAEQTQSGIGSEELQSYQTTLSAFKEEQTELLADIKQIETSLSAIGASDSGIENVENDFKEMAAAAGNAEDVIDGIRNELGTLNINFKGADTVTKDLQDMNLEIQKVTARINGNDIEVSIRGIEKTADGFDKVVTATKRYEDAIDNTSNVNKTISQTFETSSDAAKKAQKETEDSFKRLKSLAQEMSKLEIAKLDASKSVDEINSLERVLNGLESEYRELYSTIEKNLSADQFKELDKIFANTTGEVREFKNELAKSTEAQELTSGLEKLKSITKEIAGLKIDVFNFEDVDNIQRASNRLSELEKEAAELRAELQRKFPTASFDQIDDIARKGEEALSKLVNKAAEAKAELARDIKLDIELGNFDDEISKMQEKFNKLSNASKELRESKEQVEKAFSKMELAAGTDDEIADTEKLIEAQKEYAASLEKTNNLLRIQAREEKAAAEMQKLQDDRELFQSKIDSWLTQNSAATKKFGASMLELKAKAESCDRVTLNHLEKEFKKLDNAAEKSGLKIQNLADRIRTKFKEYSAYLSVAEVFMYITQGLKDMFDQVVAIDTAMTELKKVTDETDASYNQFLSNAASRAKEIGTTIDGLVTSTADFARLGYGFKDAQGLAEVANIYAVVGDEIDSVEGATQSLISTLAAFKDEASGISDSDFAIDIVDKFNEVSNNFAISSGGIGEAMQRSASSLRAANNTIDESIALITAANTVVQDPTSVGTAFKTISMRIRGAKTELEEAGLETEGMVESTAKLRQEILALTGVDIMDGANQFKSTYAIMDELAAKWKDLTDIQQATVTELIAGKRQGNIVSSLMQNFDVARDALETSLNSSGSAMKEHEKWQQSLEARLLKLKATWQSLSQSFMSSDFLKVALDGVIALVDGIDKLISAVGALPTLLGIFTAISSLNKISLVSKGVGGLKSLADILPVLSSAFPNAAKGIGIFTTALSSGAGIIGVVKAALSGLWTVVAAHPIIATVAAVGLAIVAFNKWHESSEELAERIGEVTAKYKEQRDSLTKLKGSYDTSNEDSMISKYERLSKGVNALGENVSLTADEYSEYKSIVDTIAGQIPSLVTGYNSQGDAILSCAGNVDKLSEAYKNLIREQNKAVLDTGADIFKDFENDLKKESKGLAHGDVLEGLDNLESLFNAKGDGSKSNIYSILHNLSESQKQQISRILEDYGIERDKLGSGKKGYETWDEHIRRALNKNIVDVEAILSEASADLNAYAEDLGTVTEAYFSKAFLDDYSHMSERMQNVINQVTSGFNSDFYAQFLDDENPYESLTKYYDSMLEAFDSLGSTGTKEFEAAFNLKTQFNNGDISYGEYIKNLEDAGELIDGLNLDEEVKNQIKLTLDIKEVQDEYEALKNRLTSDEYNIQMKTEEAEKFLDGLTSSEYAVAVDLMMSGEVDLSDFDIKSLREYIEKQAKINEAMNYTIAIDVETESLDALNTAMAESVSGAGLSSEAIAALKGRYAELESEGYNLSAMFEETANGIHLNRKAVGELEQKLASNKLVETDKQLSVLKNRYDELTTEIDKCRDAGDRAALYTEQQSIVEKINDLATLASQYEGLTSAYNAWQNAESAGQERDMYESVIEGFENIGDEISRGWVDDGTIKFLELLTGKTDLAGKSGKQLKEIYDGLDDSIKYLNKDGKVLEDTGYSVRDFFTVDEDGNSTNAGVYNFLDAIGKLEEEAFGGKDVVKRDDKGNIIGFDFELVAKKDKNGNVIKNGDQVIAEALGISEELVQIMVRASDDAGFVVNLEGAYTQLADLKTEAESARDTLISLQNKGLKELKGVDVNFDLDAEGGDLVKEQEKAVKLLDKFKKNGKIDLTMEGAQQALDIAEYLTIKLDDLTEPRYMQIDATQVEEDIREPLEDMQEFERLSKEKHLLQLTGDKKKIKEVQDDMDEIANGLEDLDKETKVKLGIDGLTSEEIADKLEKGEIEIPAELNLDVQMSDDLKDMRLMMMNQLGLASDNEVKLKVGFDIDESVVDSLTDEQKEVVVKYIVENEDEFNKYTEEEKETVIKLIADGVDLDNYEVEDKEAIVNYIANGEEADGWTPEAKDAFVKYLVDGGEPDKFDPENKDSWVVYDTDTTKPDGYEPDDEDATVTYDKDSSVPDGYDPNDPTATVTYEKDSSDVDNYNPPNFIRNVVYKIKTAVSNAASKGAKVLKDRFGIGGANGTANADGTTGRAFKQGSWGTKNSGTALVGELGRETLVRDGRYYTIGNAGAEFIKYQRGDIIFNHKQTEELFNNGRVTSGGGRAKAFASGTAFSSGIGGIGRVVAVREADNGKKEIETKTKSSKKAIEVKTTIKESNSGGSSGSGGIGSVGGNSAGSGSSSSSSEKEEFEETYDWIETAINRIERAIDQLETKANSVYRSWSERNNALVGEIDKVKEEIELQQNAYDRYIEAANAVGLSSSWAAKVRNGEVDIDTITNEDLADKISNYKEWYEKALDCKDAILELKETEADLIQQKFDNVIDRYDGYLSVVEHEKNMLEEYINQSEAQGWLTSTKYYNALRENENENIAMLQQKKAELLTELSNTEAGTEQWYKNVQAIDEVTLAIEQANTAILEYEQTIQELEFEQFDILQERISALTEEAEFLIELMSNKKLYEDNGQLTDEGMSTMGLHGQSYNIYMHQADMVAEEIERIKELMSSSTSNEYDGELEERYREMIALQQEYILAAEEEKNAIRDMVEEGIEYELDALQEKIDLYNEALNSQKDLYGYQRDIEKQTQNISNLRKQITAYEGDTSDESQAKLQELRVSLQEAEEDLKQTEYEKFISDTEALLDELYNQYELTLNERLDNIDALIMDMIVEINANAGTISGTIEEVTRAVGYETSEEMKNAWNVNTSEIKEVITNYSDQFYNAHTSTKGVLDAIRLNTQNMINKLDAIASEKAAAAKVSSAAKSTKTNTATKPTTPTKATSTSGGDGVPKVGDAVTFKSGKYYNSSDGLTPTGSALLGKTVYITRINKASWAKKQYHIARDKAGKRPLGWVELSQLSGYASGKKNFLNDELAWTQENGLEEYIVRPSDGAILTPIARKGSVLNAQASENLWNMTNYPAEFIKDNLNLGAANVPNNSNSQNTYTQYLDKVVFNLPNIKNYDELLSAMQKDKNFERLISSMTIDRLAGKSSLAKGKAIR